MQEYEKFIELIAKVLEELREKYPKLTNSFYGKNILSYLGESKDMLNPGKTNRYSIKKFISVNNKLSKFNHKSFIKWLITSDWEHQKNSKILLQKRIK